MKAEKFIKINNAIQKKISTKCLKLLHLFSNFCQPLHTVSFDRFLSGLEWIINFKFTKGFDILPENIIEY